jgi:hypothetical protein
MPRKYSSISTDTTLTALLGASDTTCTVADAAALLGGVTIGAGDSFTVAIAPNTSAEEICIITAVSTNTLTITRAQGGTSASQHEIGTTIRHVLTSIELTDFETVRTNHITAASTSTLSNKTINLSNNTLTGTLAQFNTALSNGDFATIAGTETITNKTLTSPIINDPKLNLSINGQTGTTYTLVLEDNGKLITLSNVAAIAVTVPTNANVAFPIGAQVNITQTNTGAVTVAGDSGVTVNSVNGLQLFGQWSIATLIKIDTDSWIMIGSVKP